MHFTPSELTSQPEQLTLVFDAGASSRQNLEGLERYVTAVRPSYHARDGQGPIRIRLWSDWQERWQIEEFDKVRRPLVESEIGALWQLTEIVVFVGYTGGRYRHHSQT